MRFVSTDDAVAAYLWADAAFSPAQSTPLSDVAEAVGDDALALSQRFAVVVAVQSLEESGLVRRVSTGSHGVELALTAAGLQYARGTYARLERTTIGLVDESRRRQITVGEAARELDRSVPDVVTACSPEGTLYACDGRRSGERVDRQPESDGRRGVAGRFRDEASDRTLVFVGPADVDEATLVEAVRDSLGDDVEPVHESVDANRGTGATGALLVESEVLSDVDTVSD